MYAFEITGTWSVKSLLSMASIKNIPYGFNANYETVIKIIGSKYVKYLVEKPNR